MRCIYSSSARIMKRSAYVLRCGSSRFQSLPSWIGIIGVPVEYSLSSQNEELQEQLHIQQKEVYSLHQEVFRLSRENQILQDKVCLCSIF